MCQLLLPYNINYAKVSVQVLTVPSEPFSLNVSCVFDVVSITRSPLSTGVIVVAIQGVIPNEPLTSSL